MRRKTIAVLGSTGSIGVNTLDVAARYPDRFRVYALTAYNNLDLLVRQMNAFVPKVVACRPERMADLRAAVGRRRIRVCDVTRDLEEIAGLEAVETVVIGMSGSEALHPFLRAVRCGKTVAPANKEALVIAGELIMKEARRHHAAVIPVDSEQSAIFQCLQGQNRAELARVYLTASGGPLLRVGRSRFSRLTVKDILKHPRWQMGRKITVDSASLMNKGFEFIEAQRLFGLSADEIEVLIHPEAILHSMVAFKDGSVLGQMAVPDMRLPIQYALSFPQRLPGHAPSLDFVRLKALTFDRPDLEKFPSLSLAIHVARQGGTLPSVLNAADEVAVAAFLEGTIGFTKIYDAVEKVVRSHQTVTQPGLGDILAADQWARGQTQRLLSSPGFLRTRGA